MSMSDNLNLIIFTNSNNIYQSNILPIFLTLLQEDVRTLKRTVIILALSNLSCREQLSEMNL